MPYWTKEKRVNNTKNRPLGRPSFSQENAGVEGLEPQSLVESKLPNLDMSTLTINTRQNTNAAGLTEVTLTLDGNLDNSTVANFETKLMPILAQKPAQIIFNLSGLKYVTSAGIRMFFMAVKQQKQHAGQVSFVNLQPQIKEVFAIMGNIPDMRIFVDQAELDAYLLSRQKTYEQ